MRCPRCEYDNPPGTKFCGECAAPLAAVCAACGAANPAANTFCGQCAAPLRVAADKFPSPQSYTPKHLAEKILISKAALESASVSYGKATSYLPVIDLLKGYFKIQDRDDLREIREKVTGKLLTLDRALEPTLPALLALLDAPVDDAAWQTLDPGQRRQLTLDAAKRLLRREAREQALGSLCPHCVDARSAGSCPLPSR